MTQHATEDTCLVYDGHWQGRGSFLGRIEASGEGVSIGVERSNRLIDEVLVVASGGRDEHTIPTRNDSYVEKRTIPTRKILKSVGSPWEVRGKSVGSGQTEILN